MKYRYFMLFEVSVFFVIHQALLEVRDIFTVFKSMLKYAQEKYGFRLSLKNVVLPKAERKQVEKLSDTEQKKLVSYLK